LRALRLPGRAAAAARGGGEGEGVGHGGKGEGGMDYDWFAIRLPGMNTMDGFSIDVRAPLFNKTIFIEGIHTDKERSVYEHYYLKKPNNVCVLIIAQMFYFCKRDLNILRFLMLGYSGMVRLELKKAFIGILLLLLC
jgi:hypothetical protein